MWDQEKEHRKMFDQLLPKYRTRPTVVRILIYITFRNQGSALLSPKMAMACTAAVETVITEHCNDQIRTCV